jgi:molybdopterin converting factor small subunit
MIRVKFLGHIRTSMGTHEIEINRDGISVGDVFALLHSGRPAEVSRAFTKYNTLVVVNEGEAFSASSQEARRLVDGDSVMLVPFSHGG